MSDPRTPADVEAAWDLDGMTAHAIPAMGIAYVRGRRSTVEVRIEPGARSSYSWLKGDVRQSFSTRAIRAAVVPENGLPRLKLTLDPERAEVQGTAHQRRGEMVLRFQTRAHARWVADRFAEAIEHRSEREGEAASVPPALAQLQAARRQDEG